MLLVEMAFRGKVVRQAAKLGALCIGEYGHLMATILAATDAWLLGGS